MISTALPSILIGPPFGFQPVNIAAAPATLGIPAGIDGLERLTASKKGQFNGPITT